MGNSLTGEFFYLFQKYGPELVHKHSEGHTRLMQLRLLCNMTGMIGYYNKYGHFTDIIYFADMDDATKKMRGEIYGYYMERGETKEAVQWEHSFTELYGETKEDV